MAWFGIIIIGIISLTIILVVALIIKRFFGISGVFISAAAVGFFIVGLYIGNRVWSTEDPRMKYSYCSELPLSNSPYEYMDVYFFYKDTPMGTKIGLEELNTAPYPITSITPLHVTADNVSSVEGKILCVDASEGQMVLETMVKGCNP